MTSGGGINDVVLALDVGAADTEVLALLSSHVDVIVGDDLVHRLVPFAARLATFDYDDFPWAGLSCGVAVCSMDRRAGRAILGAARQNLEGRGDSKGVGYGCFLEGLQDLGEGNMEGAARWWAQAMPLVTGSAALMISSHLALAAYTNGDVDRAVLLAQEALWAAEHAQDARSEVIACMGLGLFHLASGRFSSVELHVRRGLETIQRLESENRYELPMLLLADAVLHTLRGDRDASESGYTAAIDESVRRGNRWYEAICRGVRAEFTAMWHPDRAIADARGSLEYLDSINEQWWSRSARVAYATAHLRAGNLDAGKAACSTLLGLDLNPLDRGRTLLIAAELSAASGDDDAASLALQARDVLAGTGAMYWAGRANMTLSRLDRRRREFHRRRAVLCAGAEVGDPAWRVLFRGPGVLSIGLLGEGSLSVDGVPVRFESRAELECLAMLALAPRGLATTTIGDRLWPDENPARVAHRVDNLISGLRRRLDPTSRLNRDRSRVSLELLPGECDVRDLIVSAETHLGAGDAVDRSPASSIRQLLARPLLDDIRAPWVGLEQHRLHEMARRLESRAG